MTSIPRELATLLGRVRRPGDFYATGTIDIHPPRLEVDGVGPIALPLLPVQAEQIIAVAERAPYGRGTETLLDTDVRRTWQVGAERVRISGRLWDHDLAVMVERAADGLGVVGQIEAELYKLLVYDTGSFFVRHRDSEKAPGMFATLVVVLPSDYRGGELLVKHKGREVRLDLRRDEPSEAAFAAFYADCRHQVLPIASGYRLALIYNLARKGGEPLPKPPDYEQERAQASSLLHEWAQMRESVSGALSDRDGTPEKLIFPLEHAYTQAELGFAALKGTDAAVAGVMIEAARREDWDLYLALVSIAESGWAEYAGGGRYWDDAEGEFEVGEVEESSQTVHDWRHPDGSRLPLGPLPFRPEELSPPDAFDDLEPEELEFQEATGNAGASFERLYQRAALVLWPCSRRVQVLAQGGLGVSVPFLGELVRQWQAVSASRKDPAREEAHLLAAQIRLCWPEQAWERQRASQAGHTAALLGHLIELDDREEIDAFLAGQVAGGALGKGDAEAVARALGLLSPTRASELLVAIVVGNAPARPGACADLLARFAGAGASAAAQLRPAAMALLESLPRDESDAPPSAFGRGRETASEELVVDTLGALERLDSSLAQQALEHFLAHPRTYPMDGVLLPAALRLKEAQETGWQASVVALGDAVMAHLRQRIDEPLEPPADWRRPSAIACSCTYCVELSHFLADPFRPSWQLKAAQAARGHVEESIRSNRCDLDCHTETRGRPYTLHCTKNQASYQRRVEQRGRDLEHLARLEGKQP
jgi:hypothetical protein